MTATAIPVSELNTTLATARHLGLGTTDLQCLLLIAEHEEINMTCLAVEIGISTAAMTSTAKRLIGKCLIKRAHSHAADMRVVNLRLTELGRSRVFQLTGTVL